MDSGANPDISTMPLPLDADLWLRTMESLGFDSSQGFHTAASGSGAEVAILGYGSSILSGGTMITSTGCCSESGPGQLLPPTR
jgi:hypothetical protein